MLALVLAEKATPPVVARLVAVVRPTAARPSSMEPRATPACDASRVCSNGALRNFLCLAPGALASSAQRVASARTGIIRVAPPMSSANAAKVTWCAAHTQRRARLAGTATSRSLLARRPRRPSARLVACRRSALTLTHAARASRSCVAMAYGAWRDTSPHVGRVPPMPPLPEIGRYAARQKD